MRKTRTRKTTSQPYQRGGWYVTVLLLIVLSIPFNLLQLFTPATDLSSLLVPFARNHAPPLTRTLTYTQSTSRIGHSCTMQRNVLYTFYQIINNKTARFQPFYEAFSHVPRFFLFLSLFLRFSNLNRSWQKRRTNERTNSGKRSLARVEKTDENWDRRQS